MNLAQKEQFSVLLFMLLFLWNGLVLYVEIQILDQKDLDRVFALVTQPQQQI